MALIKCNECGKDISDQAVSCPSCGNPLKDKIITVQLTSKRWKLIKMISWVVFLVGLSNAFAGNTPDAKAIGSMAATFGFIGILVGKFGAWWSNK